MFRFPWGDMHSLNLGWFLQKFNELREDWATAEAGIDGALDAEIQRAEDALSDVFDARDAAAASATAAAGSASSAGTSATAAQNSATAAASSATLANQKASAAGLSEAAAAQSATAASNSATAAATSATQAGNSATAAGNSATTAGQQATAAAGSATAAAGSASDAADSATAAAASAAAAEAVEESIPEDYSTLSADVAELSTPFGRDQIKLFFKDVDLPFQSNAAHLIIRKNIIKVTGGSGSAYYQIIGTQTETPRVVQSTAGNLPNVLTPADFTAIPTWLATKPTTRTLRQLDLTASLINIAAWPSDDAIGFRIFGATLSQDETAFETLTQRIYLNPTRNYPLALNTIYSYLFNAFEGYTHFCVVIASQSRASGKQPAIVVNLNATGLKMTDV